MLPLKQTLMGVRRNCYLWTRLIFYFLLIEVLPPFFEAAAAGHCQGETAGCSGQSKKNYTKSVDFLQRFAVGLLVVYFCIGIN